MTAFDFLAVAAAIALARWPHQIMLSISCIVLGLFAVLFTTVYLIVGLAHIFGIFVAGFVAGVLHEFAAGLRRSFARGRSK